MQNEQFWEENALKNIKPDRGGEFPEGFNSGDTMAEYTSGKVVDIGCGYGRHCQSFEDYVGYDISSQALNKAKELHPGKDFRKYVPGASLEVSDWQIYYTILIHIHPEDIELFLKNNLQYTNKVIVGDIMDMQSKKNVTFFPRSASEHLSLFDGFNLTKRIDLPCDSYPGRDVTLLILER